MNLYINPINNDVYAYEADGSQDDFIPEGFIAVSSERPSANHVPIVSDGKHIGWQLPETEPFNYPTVSKLKLKRRLDDMGLWQDLRALMVADGDMWDEWLIAGDIAIDDPMALSAAAAMEWSPEQLQALFNQINTEYA